MVGDPVVMSNYLGHFPEGSDSESEVALIQREMKRVIKQKLGANQTRICYEKTITLKAFWQ